MPVGGGVYSVYNYHGRRVEYVHNDLLGKSIVYNDLSRAQKLWVAGQRAECNPKLGCVGKLDMS